MVSGPSIPGTAAASMVPTRAQFMTPVKLTRLPTLKSAEAFGELVRSLNLDLQFEPQPFAGVASSLMRPLPLNGRTLVNWWAIHPVGGGGGTRDGGLHGSMVGRWQRFGQSGPQLIWGGEA